MITFFPVTERITVTEQMDMFIPPPGPRQIDTLLVYCPIKLTPDRMSNPAKEKNDNM